MMNQNRDRMTSREVIVASAEDEIASRQQRIEAIKPEEERLDAELAPLYSKQIELRNISRPLKREITGYEVVIDSGGRKLFQGEKMTVELAREKMTACRAKIADVDTETRQLNERLKPMITERSKLESERARLEKEVSDYAKVISSSGKKTYADVTSPSAGPCMA